MARTELPIVVLDPTTALPVTGASCVIVDRATANSATTYTDESGSSTITQPVLTDASGRLNAWVNRGRYQITITISGRPPYVEYWDSAPAADGGIDSAWLATDAVTSAKIASSAVSTAKIADDAVTVDKLGPNAVDGTALSSSGGVDASRAVSTNHLKDAAVTGAKIANNAIGANHLSASLIPLGMVIDWWRASTGVSIPAGWAICDGTAWASIPNDLGLSTGTIPNLVGVAIVGARLTTVGPGSGSPADGLASSNGNAWANAPGIGGTGGSMAAINFAHTHTINHGHGVIGVDHLHGIAADGYHDHAATTATRGSPNGYAAGGGESVAFTNHTHGIYANGAHSHGGGTGAADRSLWTSTYSQDNTSSGSALSSTQDVRPRHIGLLKLMRVKNT